MIPRTPRPDCGHCHGSGADPSGHGPCGCIDQPLGPAAGCLLACCTISSIIGIIILVVVAR